MTETFQKLGLIEPILDALADEGYTKPTPIQTDAIPHLLEGRDVLAVAQTGTGKTAAFTLPMLQLFSDSDEAPRPRRPRALVLTPTRELAAQIGDSAAAYGRYLDLRHTVIFGGVGQRPQVKVLERGVDIVVATPGRLLDLLGQGHVLLDEVEIAVLDEADRMLDMGFIRDVERILRHLPKERQTLLFSATMPPEIAKLAQRFLRDPVKVAVTPVSSTAERIDQRVLLVGQRDKRALLTMLLEDPAIERALVFTRTKHGANRVAKQLAAASVVAEAIHGNKSQTARQRALDGFKKGRVRILVATDIAARGIDVDDVTHVINYDMPVEPESYVHRIGRTARAGRGGAALSFCSAEERDKLKRIERVIRRRVPIFSEHPYHDATPWGATPKAPPKPARPNGGRRGGARRRR